MKFIDCLLLSLAIPSTLLTVYVLGSKNKVEPTKAEVKFYRKVVIHSPCGRVQQRPKLNCHFAIDREGKLYSTWAWDQRVPVNHTSDLSINQISLAVLIEPGGDTKRQHEALAQFVRSLQMGEDCVLVHHDSCPGRNFSWQNFHKAMEQIDNQPRASNN